MTEPADTLIPHNRRPSMTAADLHVWRDRHGFTNVGRPNPRTVDGWFYESALRPAPREQTDSAHRRIS
jgi:hypothetical protein